MQPPVGEYLNSTSLSLDNNSDSYQLTITDIETQNSYSLNNEHNILIHDGYNLECKPPGKWNETFVFVVFVFFAYVGVVLPWIISSC